MMSLRFIRNMGFVERFNLIVCSYSLYHASRCSDYSSKQTTVIGGICTILTIGGKLHLTRACDIFIGYSASKIIKDEIEKHIDKN